MEKIHLFDKVISPIVTEWGIFTEPFTFMIDKKGIVSAKYEGFVTYGEIESDLIKMIKIDF